MFALDDEEIASYGKTNELNSIELFESYRVQEIERELNKIGISLKKYLPMDKAQFVVAGSDNKTEVYVNCLKDILEEVKKEAAKGIHIQRYKGLGEMNPEQLWESTMAPQKRNLIKVTLEDAVEADNIFTILMGEKTEPRREFIQSHAHEVKNLDV